jgi:NAD(P)-dependent dehydrogenase (short-subunit alcohol dehydrogenase family)
MSTIDTGHKPLSYVVLGATGSVGSELSRRLSKAGHQVMLAGRNQQILLGLSEELQTPSCRVEAEEPESIDLCLQQAANEFGSVDGVVNCMGSVLLKPAHLTSVTEWNQTLAVNLTAAFSTVRSAAQVMRQSGGSIVLISSAAARVGLANHEAIAAAKAGVAGLTLSAAATYASRGIRVNAVAPGLVKSNMTRQLWESESAAATSKSMHALDRLGEPADVASLIVWLLQPENSWMTGQILGIDGGLASVIPRTRQKSG